MLSTKDELRNDGSSIVIAVMGPTGTGKSSFIKRLTGAPNIVIGHSIASATTKAESYSMIYKGREVVLVDTPGFDDSSGLDREVVEETLGWLRKSMAEGHFLSGIVYLHRIIDPRITGTARSNMRLFRRLCGDDRLSNVVLGLTFWTDVEEKVGLDREAQLLEDPQFWKPMASQGSRAFRLNGERVADVDVVSHITSSQNSFLMQAQDEMLEGKRNDQTSAAMTMNQGLADLEAKLKESLNEERARQQALLDSIEQRRVEELRAQQEMRAKAIAGAAKQRARMEQQLQRAEEESKRRAAEEQRLQEKVAAANAVLQAEQATAARLQQYSEYQCRSRYTKRMCCSGCGWRLDMMLGGTWCYHCCHCNNDTFYHCLNCGSKCPQGAEHGVMKPRAVERTLVARLLG